MADIAFQRNENFIDNSLSHENDNLIQAESETGNILLKTQFFSRIGIGLKTMQAISTEHRKSVTAYIQHHSSLTEDQPNTRSQQMEKSSRNLKQSPKFEEIEKENIKVNRDEETSNKQQFSMKMKSQSLGALAMKNRENDFESVSQCVGNFEFLEESDHESAIDAELDLIEEGSSSDFFVKTDQQARSCYYNRLIQMRILKPTPSKKNQNIIIFDWDDTLLCTSYLMALGIKSATPLISSVLTPVDEIACKLLNKAVGLGQVFIITNAEQGWVQSSARNFLPKTYSIIKKADITVISARTCYEDEFPDDMERWKKEAFSSLTRIFEKDLITNLICIGDSNTEINAAHLLAKKFDSAIIKTIKFKEKPKPEELTKQHCLVLEKFDKLFVSLRNSAIRLEKKCI